jgi:hypothetical protein
MRKAITEGEPELGWDFELLHAVRMSKLAHYHACRAVPALRAPDAYELAVAKWREQRQ